MITLDFKERFFSEKSAEKKPAVKKPAGKKRTPLNDNKSESGKQVINLAKLRRSAGRIENVMISEEFRGKANPLVAAAEQTELLNQNRETAMKAKKILDICYQPGRIFDMLARFEEFVNGISENMNTEIVRAKGYCNYLFYVENEMKKLNGGDFSDLSEGSFEAALTGEKIIDFAQKECGGSEGISLLISAKNGAERILAKPRTQIGPTDFKNYNRILGVAEDCENIFASALPEIEEIAVSVSNQTEAVKKNIASAREIYSLLTEKLTEEWFESMNYELEACPINVMGNLEIKQYLGAKIEEIKEISAKYEN